MSFEPFIPSGGNLGWILLSRTQEAQRAAYVSRVDISQNIEYARSKLPKIQSAEDLVSDRRLLTVALGAFGLSDDLDNRFFIKKVLDEGTRDPKSFANRLSDRRYSQLSEAFSFDLEPPNTVLSRFVDRITSAYADRSFEVAVGEFDPDLRLALSLERELLSLIKPGGDPEAVWFGILGTPQVRIVFEKAFGLPDSFAGIPIDQQLDLMQRGARREFGTDDPRVLLDTDVQEQLIRKFLLRRELDQASFSSSASVALSLLQTASISNPAV